MGKATIVQVIVHLWRLDSGEAREKRLRTILAGFPIADRMQLQVTRRLHKVLQSDTEGFYFTYAARARAILYYQCKVLRALFQSEEILSKHRRQWRSFQRGETLIESLPDESLRDELIAQYRAAMIEVQRAQRGKVLTMLEREA